METKIDKLFALLQAPLTGDYLLKFKDDDGELDETCFSLSAGETETTLRELWLDFCAENEFDPNGLIEINKGTLIYCS